MAQKLYLWKGTERVNLIFGDEPNGIIKKLVNINNHIFVSTTTYNIYCGQVIVLEDQSLSVTLKRIDFYAVDIASNSKYLFIVDDHGHVLTVDPNNLQVIDKIIIKDDIKICSHGYKQENETIRIKNIAISDTASLFVSENGQLWGSGDQPHVDIKTQTPKKIIFFDGRTVSLVACGSNFNVVVARKISKCLQNIITPQSLTSSDTCGLHPEDNSVTSISPVSFSIKGRNSTSKSTIGNKTFINNIESIDNDDKEKKNPIFINTEAARQFLTRQLSWVSSYSNSKEDEYISNPTGLIKQNVSSMANLVYEGVKTMGDKVVTLSRHVSGSSDINDLRDDTGEDFEHNEDDNDKPTANSLAHSLRCEEFPWSSSTASLDHELSQQGLNERINSLVDAGNSILGTELWTYGDIRFGQLGTGDIINRAKPVLVNKLHNTGIKKISCGSYHVLALTLDGRIYGWGKNDCHQVAPNEINDQSSPQLINSVINNYFNNKIRAKDLAAGSRHSLINFDNNLFFIGKSNDVNEIVKLDMSDDDLKYCIKFVSSSGAFSCCSIINQELRIVINDLTNEEILLEEMIIVNQHLIKPFKKKSNTTQESNAYNTLCHCYTELMSFIALNVLSLCDFSNYICEAYEVTLVANVDEFITVYRYYLNAICDITSLGGFVHIAKIMNELPLTVVRLFKDKVVVKSKQIQNEDLIVTALQHPLQQLNRYKVMISNLIKSNGTNMGIERLQEALVKWERFSDDREKRQREADQTKTFWENSGKLIELLRSPERRLIRESRSHPISLLNSSRFSSHWFILLTDCFIHVIGTSHTVHPLPTLWVEPLADTETLLNAISITTPEDYFIIYTSTASERNEWLQSLQNAIKNSLQKVVGHTPPRDRTSTFVFLKHPVYKDAKYTGRWSNGKPHGFGKLEWADGKLYTGQFYKGVINGTGKMEISTQGIYEGEWKDGQQNGYGSFKYINGDVYDGYFKDGLPHGHGVKKEGQFMASVATVYIGEWMNGVKYGYGVMDNILTGEKYLGLWSNNVKHGCGLIVTLDGIYYEGSFVQDIMTGHGLMIFEDKTHYEGEFKSVGIFGGKGILTFCSGDILEGNIHGAWNEPVKVTATLKIKKASIFTEVNAIPPSFGKLCVLPDQKWKAIFRQCYQQLGVSEPNIRNVNSSLNNDKLLECQKLWENVAVIINKSHEKSLRRDRSPSKNTEKKNNNDLLNKIPQFGQDKITLISYNEIHNYLTNAFESRHHPLGNLLIEISSVYTASYGGVRVHPLLLSHAVAELRSITLRIYDIVILFFPALPSGDKEYVLETDDQSESKVISATAILHPILLPRVHSALFVLYALHNKKEDDAYWERLKKWNKQPDITLMAFLDIDQKFWSKSNITLDVNDGETSFIEAIETLQQLKTTFSPLEKLLVIRNTFEQMTKTVQKQLGTSYLWTMDELFPVFNFVVVRASVLQLGSECHFIEDFMEPFFQNGELGIMFTTLKACYYQILQEKMSIAD
ncbi:alsin isoform X2 [Microplitis mediator]|uniref:alsin isoform X2 n=1 Tax=Microplitis mediator TaxID=375433 RepID=UPI0025548968|nr:alsin isoform X2 [Microplitis mediator]